MVAWFIRWMMTKSSFPCSAIVSSAQSQLNGDAILSLSVASLPICDMPMRELLVADNCLPVLWENSGGLLVYQYASNKKSYVTGDHLDAKLIFDSALSLSVNAVKKLLVSDVVGLPYVLACLAREKNKPDKPSFLLDANTTLPVDLVPSRFIVNSLPAHVTASLSLLEDWGITARVACEPFKPGCYDAEFGLMLTEFVDGMDEPVYLLAAGQSDWLAKLPMSVDSKIEC